MYSWVSGYNTGVELEYSTWLLGRVGYDLDAAYLVMGIVGYDPNPPTQIL